MVCIYWFRFPILFSTSRGDSRA